MWICYRGNNGEGAVVEGKYETDIYMGILEDDYRKFIAR